MKRLESITEEPEEEVIETGQKDDAPQKGDESAKEEEGLDLTIEERHEEEVSDTIERNSLDTFVRSDT